MLRESDAISSYSVNNVGEAMSFYRDILGLDVKETVRGMELTLHSAVGTTDIFIYPKSDHEPASFTVLNFRVKDIKAVVEGLIDKGVHFEQYDTQYIKTDDDGISWNDDLEFGPRGIAWFTDPADNLLSVVQEK